MELRLLPQRLWDGADRLEEGQVCGVSGEALAVAPRTDLDTGVLVAPT